VKRRTTPKVKDGRVQKKNNWSPDRGDYFVVPQSEIRLERTGPGAGYRHLLTLAQLRRAVALLPDWDEVAVGLDAIALTGCDDAMGWHVNGVIVICSWDHDLWWNNAFPSWLDEHREILDRLEVERRRIGPRIEVRWTESQARAFQVLHILPHELGHHHDRMTTRSRAGTARGEPYAEEYAIRALDAMWPGYVREFGL
jgi:hypothetical protein